MQTKPIPSKVVAWCPVRGIGCLGPAWPPGAAGCGGSPASHPLPAPSSPRRQRRAAPPRRVIRGRRSWPPTPACGMRMPPRPARPTTSQVPCRSTRPGDALMILTRSLYDNHQHGVVLRGAPALDPHVTGMTPAGSPDSSSVTDCADDSRWLQYTTSGKPGQRRPGRAAPHLRPAAAVRLRVESDQSRGGEGGDMLRHALARAAVVIMTVVIVTGSWQGAASADGQSARRRVRRHAVRPELHARLHGDGRNARKQRHRQHRRERDGQRHPGRRRPRREAARAR